MGWWHAAIVSWWCLLIGIADPTAIEIATGVVAGASLIAAGVSAIEMLAALHGKLTQTRRRRSP
jgi:hypothetical protein